MGRSHRNPGVAAALIGLMLLGAAPAAAQGGYPDCAPRAAGIDAPRLKQAILAAALPRRAAGFFADNVVVVAPARLRPGSRDLLTYVAGPAICGTGGCNAYLFDGADYRPLARIVPARLPIRALERVHHGRRDIGVAVNGGGVRKGYVGALAFDGRAYPGNPTLASVRRAAPGAGAVLIGLPGQAKGQCRLR